MGVATELGSLASFVGYWLPLMAAIMLPGAVSLGVMSTTWMSLIAALVLAQKLVPEHRAVDVPVALAIVALGIAATADP